MKKILSVEQSGRPPGANGKIYVALGGEWYRCNHHPESDYWVHKSVAIRSPSGQAVCPMCRSPLRSKPRNRRRNGEVE